MDREAWHDAVHGVTKSLMWLSHWTELNWWYVLRLLRWLRQWRICPQSRRPGFDPWVGKIPWRREWQPTAVFFPGVIHGLRSLTGYRPCGCRVGCDWTTSTNTHTHKLTPRVSVRSHHCRKYSSLQTSNWVNSIFKVGFAYSSNSMVRFFSLWLCYQLLLYALLLSMQCFPSSH